MTISKPLNKSQKLILSLLKEKGRLPKVDLARHAKLSPTAIASIIKKLEKEKLVVSCPSIKGHIGQPAVPFDLNQKGIYSIGIKIGRRSVEISLIDFKMNLINYIEELHEYPDPNKIFDFILKNIPKLNSVIPKEQKRICGIGICIPCEIWKWEKEMEAPIEILEKWNQRNLFSQWQKELQYPLYILNDSNAACTADLNFRKTKYNNIIYFFLGWFAGGAVVINKSIYHGKNNRGGSVGSMPMLAYGTNHSKQLIHCASLYTLEKELFQKGFNKDTIWTHKKWQGFEQPLQEWLTSTAESIAYSIAAAQSIIDFEAAIIEGSMPEDVKKSLVTKIKHYHTTKINLQGLSQIPIFAGHLGRRARSLGAATVPIIKKFFS